MHKRPLASIDLVLSAQRDDARARDLLIQRCLPRVVAWCRWGGGRGIDPEDAAQDVMITMLTRLHTLREPERFEAWLHGITRRVLSSQRRRAWVQRRSADAPDEGVDASPSPMERYGTTETRRGVRQALEALPESQRAVMILCDLEGRSSFEVAASLGIPSGTVRSRLRLGRARFRNEAESMGLRA